VSKSDGFGLWDSFARVSAARDRRRASSTAEIVGFVDSVGIDVSFMARALHRR
jgi:hypothetical protein